MTSRWIIWTVIILMGFVPHHVVAQGSGNIEINLDVIKRFEKPAPITSEPVKKAPSVKRENTAQSNAAPAKKFIPAPSRKLISAYPDGTLKTKAVLEYEQSLRELRAKYFPEQITATKPAAENDTAKPSTAKPSTAPLKKAAASKPKSIAPAPRKIEPIPAPSYPPPRQSNVKEVKAEDIAPPVQTNAVQTQKASQSQGQNTAHIVQQKTSGNSSDARAPKPSEIKGLKIVSIAYMDEEIVLNDNVQSALVSTYIPRLKAQKSYRIGLYSYSSVINRSDKQARAISLERAIALKDFLVASGIDKRRIDIFPAGKSEQASFSDWIDIILQK